MSLQSDIADDLRRDEGFRAKAYPDTEGYLTIGYGFLIDERRGDGIPIEIAEVWLDYLIKRSRTQLMGALPWTADQPHDVQRVLTELVYQLGLAGLLKFEKMLEALKNGARLNAAAELRDSKLYKQATARIERHAKLLEGDS